MANEVVYDFVRGDDFSIPMTLTDPENNGNPIDITGWTIASQVRYSKKLIDDAVVTITTAIDGEFTVSIAKEKTVLWPTRRLKCDIQFDRPVQGRVSSQTFIIAVSEDQTQ